MGTSIQLFADYMQDVPYLSRVIEEIQAELKEREDLDSLIVKKPKRKS